MEISLRIAAVADVGYIRGADQALHREHSTSMSETDGAGILTDLQARADAFSLALAKTARIQPDANRLHDLARRALAEDALRFASSAQDRGRETALGDHLIEFAQHSWPESSSWSTFRGVLSRRHAGRIGPLGATTRRARRRMRDESYYLRWMVFGV